mmetsp:Transcript_24836/g.23865  ORF Transcript_24836/g.23865 Transcript_24836/m.23865 type:complete len:157 (-) Transcript_24836:459-929(-)
MIITKGFIAIPNLKSCSQLIQSTHNVNMKTTELTPEFTLPSVKKRRKVGFSSFSVLRDENEIPLSTNKNQKSLTKCSISQPKRKNLRLEKSTTTSELSGQISSRMVPCDFTSIETTYSIFKPQSKGLFQSQKTEPDLSWGQEDEEENYKIIYGINR